MFSCRKIKLSPPAPVAVYVEPVNLPLLLLKKEESGQTIFHTHMFQFVCQAIIKLFSHLYICVNLYDIKLFTHSYV